MLQSSLRRRCVALVLAGSCACQSSCGTLLHSERIGQPPGRLDPAIVILDGVGLLLFLIPGAIAFAVDFYTGAIYLPPEYAQSKPTSNVDGVPMVTVKADPRTLTPQRLEEILSKQTGHSVQLSPGQYVATRIESVGQMSDRSQELALHGGDHANAVIFRCQSE